MDATQEGHSSLGQNGREEGPYVGALQSPPLGATTRHAAETALRKIIAQEISPVVLVVGSPSQYEQLSDVLARAVEPIAFSIVPESRSIDISLRRDILVAFRRSEGKFSFVTSHDLAECCADQRPRAKLIYVGSPRNVSYAVEAIKSCAPHFPVVVVSLEGMRESSSKVCPSIPSLAIEKIDLSAGDEQIISVLSSLTGRCLDGASAQAQRLLTTVEIPNSGDPIPQSVYRCLEQTLLREACASNLHILLRGGCGIVSFMPKARPISPDIDFTALLRVEEFDHFKILMQRICKGGEVEVHGCPSLNNSQKSTYIKGKVVVADHNDAEVSLDAVAVRRVKGDLFSFEFKYDQVMNRYHHIVQLDSGAIVGVVAPELTLVEKLVAGRGREVDKFDILDATGILANQPLEYPLIQRAIERQRYDESIDGTLETQQIRAESVDRDLQSLGIVSDVNLRLCVLNALHNNSLFSWRHNLLKAKGEVYHILTPDTLKKLALVNKLLVALHKAEVSIHEIDNRLQSPCSMADLWGEGPIRAGVVSLRSFLYSYVENQLLRKDVYAYRNSRSFERSHELGFWDDDASEHQEQAEPPHSC